ncbi:hypothetical protein [Pseudoruegeria sp. HB172150]|uniref:hypothetical protein n=1 Tax=Pseudoruegeria sp. HB172150 TaxID=2721164 RepID=UPI00155615FF|nr:hypothetical protein [Pseudoruegeria sp. HB172150]
MATYIVTTLADEGVAASVPPDAVAEAADGLGLSLREAIALANADAAEDAILFAPDLANGRIVLRGETLSISTDMTIDGDAIGGTSGRIVLDADDGPRTFSIAAGDVEISGFDITNAGHPSNVLMGGGNGAGIWIAEGASAKVYDVRIQNNTGGGYSFETGGGIHNEGTLWLTNSEVTGNETGITRETGVGGGIANSGTMYLDTVLIADNAASGRIAGPGGGIYNTGTAYAMNLLVTENYGLLGSAIYNSGTFVVSNATVTGNRDASAYYGNTVAIHNAGDLTLIQSTVTSNPGLEIDNRAYVAAVNSIVTETIGWSVHRLGTNVLGTAVMEGDSIIDYTSVAQLFENTGAGGALLTDNGGPFPTLLLRADASNPALDVGNAELATDALGSALLTDARGDGFARQFDLFTIGNEGPGTTDLGALELNTDFADVFLIADTLHDVLSYSGKQDKGSFEVTDHGATLIQTGNAWNHVLIDYEVTSRTILTFGYETLVEGEVHAIGFENDENPDATTFFQLDGSQGFGIQDFNGLSDTGQDTFAIPVGRYFTGTFDRLVFVTDQDGVPGNPAALAQSAWSNFNLYESAPYVVVDNDDYPITSYSEAQDRGDFVFYQGFNVMIQYPNSWEMVEIDYDVTAKTLLEFDFAAYEVGEIHAIGFENDDIPNGETIFVLTGTQDNFGIRDYFTEPDASGGTRHYEIPVGEFFTGHYDTLVFVTDDDAESGAVSQWQDVTLADVL